MKFFSALISFISVMLLVGCSTEKRSYEITVHNQASKPITVGQVKDGESDEMWVTPEELAIRHAREGDQMWGRVVKPGQTASAGPISGTFERTESAWLRVYRGVPGFSEMLAISRKNPDRLDIRLRPGKNEMVITDETGRLEVKQPEGMRTE
jgi:hypothetical protein